MLPVTVLLSLLPFAFAAPKPQPAAHLNPRFTPPPKPSKIAPHYPTAPTGTGSTTGYGASANLSTSPGANDCGSPSNGPNDLPFSIVVPNGQQNSDVHAVDGGFWTGRKQGSVCPKSVGGDCAKYNSTKTLLKLENGALSLFVAVPGGQEVYVDSEGALSFLEAHNHAIPQGGETTGFTDVDGLAYGMLRFQCMDFMLCTDTKRFKDRSVRQLFVGGVEKPGRECVQVGTLQQFTQDTEPVTYQFE